MKLNTWMNTLVVDTSKPASLLSDVENPLPYTISSTQLYFFLNCYLVPSTTLDRIIRGKLKETKRNETRKKIYHLRPSVAEVCKLLTYHVNDWFSHFERDKLALHVASFTAFRCDRPRKGTIFKIKFMNVTKQTDDWVIAGRLCWLCTEPSARLWVKNEHLKKSGLKYISVLEKLNKLKNKTQD